MRRLRLTLPLLTVLAGCATTQPVVVVAPEPAPARTPAEPEIPGPPSVTASWHFSTGQGCTATLTSPSLSLAVAAADNRLRITAQLPRETPPPRQAYVPIAFAGTVGNWTMIGRVTAGPDIVAGQSLNGGQDKPLLALLGGGVVKVGHTGDALPTLHVPPAGAAGQSWLTCLGRGANSDNG